MQNTRAKKGQQRNQVSQVSNETSALQEVFVDALKDIYWAEKNILKELPKFIKAATSESLRESFQEHISQTEEQIERIENCFSILDMKAQDKKCQGMDGLLKEGKTVIKETEKGKARDVALIMSAQKVEHYEISAYGSLIAIANILGYDEIASEFNISLQEEKDTDMLLTDIAENDINFEASLEDEDEDEDESDIENEEDEDEDTDYDVEDEEESQEEDEDDDDDVRK